MKTRRTFLKNVLLALPLVPALAKVSDVPAPPPQAPKPEIGSWGKGTFTLLPSSFIRIEQIPNSPESYRIFLTGQGAQIDDCLEDDYAEDGYSVEEEGWWY
jgi:hypothetical protein